MRIYDFEQSGIDVSNPGFYNHPKFTAMEQLIPDFLNEYNRYVASQNYTATYIQDCTANIQIIVDILYDALAQDGRQGACIDICQVLSKILEAENIWCCIFVGSTTIQFSQETMIPDVYYWSIDSGDFAAAHTWVYAPPFSLIDLSIGLQAYRNNESKYLPRYVLAKDIKKATVRPIDIINPSILRPNTSIEEAFRGFLAANPSVRTFMEDFPPCSVEYEKCTISYFPIRATASDGELNQFRCIYFSGRSPAELYERIIKPELRRMT